MRHLNYKYYINYKKYITYELDKTIINKFLKQ